MRIAIVHYWLVNWRGGEKFLESLSRLVPDADIFTLFYDPERVSPYIRSRRVTASFLNPLRRSYQACLPLMPMALEQFDLRGYDLVISSESGPAKGVLASSSTRHVCYCHTPMRYLWELYPWYVREWTSSRWKRALMAPLTNYLRLWDYASAARVDEFIANSHNSQKRIWKTYRRESDVIYPPVPVESYYWKPADDYYLVAGELVSYKRIDMAVQVFSKNGRKLKVVGRGPEYKRLKNLAAANVEFCGKVSEEEMRDLYARCRALVVPGEEDFGMIAVEALASGKPIIGLDRGGLPEIVPEENPPLYAEPDSEQLADAIRRFERMEAHVNPITLQESVARFSEEEFARQMTAALFSSRKREVMRPANAAALWR